MLFRSAGSEIGTGRNIRPDSREVGGGGVEVAAGSLREQADGIGARDKNEPGDVVEETFADGTKLAG